MSATGNPEIGQRLDAGDIATNYHDVGQGAPVMLIHGSGPGVTAWANWRLTIPVLAERYRVVAPDMVGFGYTDRPKDIHYSLDTWVRHAIDFMDALLHILGHRSQIAALDIGMHVNAP